MRKGRDSGDCPSREEQAQGKLINEHKYLKEDVKRMEPGPFHGTQSQDKRQWHKLEHVKFHQSTRTEFFCMMVIRHRTGWPDRLWCLRSWRYSNASGHGLGQPAVTKSG